MKSKKIISISVIGVSTALALTSFLVATHGSNDLNTIANADDTYTLTLSSTNGVISESSYSSGTSSATTTDGNTFTLTYSGAKASSGNLCMLDAENTRTSDGVDGTSDGTLTGSINGMNSMVINFSYTSTVGSLAVYFSSDGSSWSDAVLASSGYSITPSGSYFKITNLGHPVTIESIVFTYACDEASHTYASSASAAHESIATSTLTGYKPSGTLSDDFAYGVDMSEVAELEELGGTFYNENGTKEDPFAIMKNDGANYVRIRLWVNPYTSSGEAYGGGTNDLDTDIMMAKRAQAAGLKIMIDLHYSDFWVDPDTYNAPKSWTSVTSTVVSEYTTSVMNSFKDAGVTVDAVQVGNEINPGIAGVDAGTTTYYNMLTAGCSAVKSVFSNALCVLHITDIQNEDTDEFIDNLCDNVSGFDILGLSYYPYWHGTMDNLLEVLNYIAAKGKQSMILETAYGWTDEGDANSYSNNQYNSDEEGVEGGFDTSTQGQVDMLSALIDTCSQATTINGVSSCIGVFYWGADWIPVENSTWATKAGQYYNDNGTDYSSSSDLSGYSDSSCKESWSNQALFDYDGKASGAAQAYKLIQESTTTWNGEVKNTMGIDYYTVSSSGSWGTAVSFTYSGRTNDQWTYTVSLSSGGYFAFVVQTNRSTWNNVTGAMMAAVNSTYFSSSSVGGGAALVNQAGLYTFTIDDDISSLTSWTTSSVASYISVSIDNTSTSYTQETYSIGLWYVNSSGSWDSSGNVYLSFDYYTNQWTGSITLAANAGFAMGVYSDSSTSVTLNGYYINLMNSTYFTAGDGYGKCSTAGTYTITVNDNQTVTNDSSSSFYTVAATWNGTNIANMVSITYSAS